MRLSDILSLTKQDAQHFVGTGPTYPWGGLYGGQIVAQALMSAATTVPDEFTTHSLRAYFIRRGTQAEDVSYEVDNVRDGRSFMTRRVLASQHNRTILNLEASFQRPETSFSLLETMGDIPGPNDLDESGWCDAFRRREVPSKFLPIEHGGRVAMWMKATHPLPDSPVPQQSGLAFISDDLPTDAVVRSHPVAAMGEQLWETLFSASLDHTIWFHQPINVNQWHLHDFNCTLFVGGRGLAHGRVFDESGRIAASISQEVLLREPNDLAERSIRETLPT